MQTETISQTQFNGLHEHYLAHPSEFTSDILASKPWHMQVEIIDAVFKYSKVAVKTCNSVGKSYIAARIAIAYLMLHPDSIVVTTAPTWNQVVNVLWREMRTAVKNAERITGIKLVDGEVKQAGLDIDTKWYAVGVSTSTPDNMMGYHANHLLVIVDEAGGVDDLIYNGVRAITTNINNKVLLIGNPTTPDGEFHKAFGPRSTYKQYTISAFDTPNFTANNINNVDDLLAFFKAPEGVDELDFFEERKRQLAMPYPELIHPGTAYDRYWEWGEDSSAWQSLIMGEFPGQADQSLIPAYLVQQAMQMHGESEYTDPRTKVTRILSNAVINGWDIPYGPPVYGQDMARYGNDRSVLTPRRGGWVEKQITWSKSGTDESAEKILAVIDKLDDTVVVNIDDTGNGGGTTDHLRYLAEQDFYSGQPNHQYTLNAYDFSRGPTNGEKFHDITSEIYWNLRSWFMNKKIALPYDEELFNELVGRRWELTPQKKIKVESKDDYKKRTKRKSPDRSDSLALAFAQNEYPNALQRNLEKVKADDGPRIAGRQNEYVAAGTTSVTGGMSRSDY